MEVETIEPCGKQENLDPIQVISVIAASFYPLLMQHAYSHSSAADEAYIVLTEMHPAQWVTLYNI